MMLVLKLSWLKDAHCSCQDVNKIFALPKKDGLRLCQIDNDNDHKSYSGTMDSLQSKCTCEFFSHLNDNNKKSISNIQIEIKDSLSNSCEGLMAKIY